MLDDQPTAFPIVQSRNGVITADSRDVANFFERRHDNVLRDIDALLASPDLGNPSSDMRSLAHPLRNDILPRVEFNAAAGRDTRYFDLTRRGFAVLAGRFTGAKALAHQIAYYDQFERMEQALLGQNEYLPPQDKPAPQPAVKKVPTGAAITATHRMIELIESKFGIKGAALQVASATMLENIGAKLPAPTIPTQKEYTTSQLAAKVEASANMVGRRCGHLKTDAHDRTILGKSQNSDRQVSQFIWNEQGRQAVIAEMATVHG